MSFNKYKKKLSFSGVTAQLITIGLLFVFWRMGQKWIVIPASITLIFLLFFLPAIIAKLEERFHKKALFLLSAGKAADVIELARKQVILSIFGDSAPIDAKLGLAYVQTGDFVLAAQYLSTAIPAAPHNEKPVLQAAYIKSLFVIGEPSKAEAEAHRLIDSRGIKLADVLIIMARSRLALGKRDEKTKELLDEAASLSLNSDTSLMLKLTLIEYNMALGKKADDVPSDADSNQLFLRVWINMVLGRQREHRGNIKDALTAYAKAEKYAEQERCWFADIAHMRIEAIKRGTVSSDKDTSKKSSVDVDNLKTKNTKMDDVILRKKRKRR